MGKAKAKVSKAKYTGIVSVYDDSNNAAIIDTLTANGSDYVLIGNTFYLSAEDLQAVYNGLKGAVPQFAFVAIAINNGSTALGVGIDPAQINKLKKIVSS